MAQASGQSTCEASKMQPSDPRVTAPARRLVSATLAALALTATALVAPAPASSATLDCNELAAGVPGVTVTIVDNVCRFLFIPTDVDENSNFTDPGDANWTLTVPAGVTKVSALLVGAGGNGASDGNREAAGGGGEVVYIDSVDASTPLQIRAGFGGYTVSVDGTSSIQGVTPEATPGSHGEIIDQDDLIIGGESGSGELGGTGNTELGAFHSASGGGQLEPGDYFAGDLGLGGTGAKRGIVQGGAGTNVGFSTTDKLLWPESLTQPGRLIASGGNVLPLEDEALINFSSVDGSGRGASLVQGKIDPRPGDHGSVEIRFAIPVAAPPANTTPTYTGPTVTSATPAAPNTQVTLTGTNLATVTRIEIDGISMPITNPTATRLTFTLPAALTPGLKDIKIFSSFGTLTVQSILRVLGENTAETTQPRAWTKAQPDGLSIKVYARNIIGKGKIQFFVDGRELAWVRATDPTDPKLRIQPDGPMAGTDYLVRTISLSPGKNRIEITLDGVRIWQATYLPKS